MPRPLHVLAALAAASALVLRAAGCDDTDDNCAMSASRTRQVSTMGFTPPPAPRPVPKAPDLPKVPTLPQAPYTPPQNNPALDGTPCG
ncbi:hypothetical protein [Streptomyces sp. NPDC050145]|uniref:hypothetical protein n=1 Tax=Streptomyces sp. NPDC050145 TaxID=3365602 RepID=UPI00378A80AC